MEYFKLNEYQNSILNIEKVYPNTSACIICGVIKFSDNIDIDKIVQANEILTKNTSILRLRLNEKYLAYISENTAQVDFVSFEKVHQMEEYIQKTVLKPFDLIDSPLCIQTVVNVNGIYYGIMKIHHIICDYIGLLNYFKKLEKIYKSLVDGTNYVNKQDKKYIDSMMGDGISYSDEAREYFKNITEKELYKKTNDIKAGIYREKIDCDLAEKIQCFSKENSVGIESLFYAALGVYYKKVYSNENTVIGCALMNRDRYSLNVIGLYANVLPVTVKGEGEFLDICKNVSDELSKTAQYGYYPFGELNKRCFDVSVSYISMGMTPKISLGSIKKVYTGYCELPLRIHIIRSKKNISIDIEYRKSLFSEEYVECFSKSIIGIINDGIDGRKLTAVMEKDIEVYNSLNKSDKCTPTLTISKKFSEFAKSHGSDIAFIYKGEEFSYKDTEKMAQAIAYIVKGKKVIGLAMGRTKYTIPAIIGILKAGGAYMPINPDTEIVSNCDMVLSVSKYNIKNAVNLDEIDFNNTFEGDLSNLDEPAYYMQTSGSAGKPKTVIISNKSLSIRMIWMNEKYGLDKLVLQKTNLTFDVSGWELLSCAFGGKCVLAEDGEERDAVKLFEYIKTYKIEIIHFVPSMLRVFLRFFEKESILEIKHLFLSGEAIDAVTIKKAAKVFKNAKIHNLYGPTECTIDVSYYDYVGDENEIPIGKPVSNTELYIVNKDNELQPCFVTGELVICGDLVGIGYSEGDGGYFTFKGKKAYKTGDYCHLGYDGNVYYECRKDTQVKINGKRIDLKYIETLCREIDGVKDCAAVYESNKVYLFYVGDMEQGDIRKYLSKKTDRLPSYIIGVPKLPINNAGKIDRKLLCQMRFERQYEKSVGKTENIINDALISELNSGGHIYDYLDRNENIFDAGMDSLSVLMAIQRLEKQGIKLSVQDFYNNPTIYELSKCVGEKHENDFLVYLKKSSTNRVVCCFPYAGGQAYSFGNITDDDVDIAVVDYSVFDDKYEIEDIAGKIKDRLCGYDEISLVSVCVGSGFAIETAWQLESVGKNIKGIYIVAGLVHKTPKGVNIWRMIKGDRLINILSKFSNEELKSDFPVDAFLRDTDRYFKYMSKEIHKINAQPYLAYGTNDKFTKGYKKKTKKWNKYFVKEPIITEFETDNHYFFKNINNLIGKMEG